MKTCGICKETYRSGGGMVYNNEMDVVRACQKCANKAIRICLTTMEVQCVVTGCKGLATYCDGCVHKKEHAAKIDKSVKGVAKQLRARAAAYKPSLKAKPGDEFLTGLIQALEDSASFLESGKWE
jgi:hypothetical protein